MKIFSKRRVWVVLLLLCVAAGIWFVASDDSAPGKAEWLSSRPAMRARLAFLGRWSGPVKRQLARVKQWFVGPTKMVMVAGTIVEFDSATEFSNLPNIRAALTSASGSRLFVLTGGAALNHPFITGTDARVLSSPRVVAGEKAQAQLAVCEPVTIGSGTNFQVEWVGFWLDVWPRINPQSIDLTCFLTSSERVVQQTNSGGVAITNGFFIRTNAAFGARVQVPNHGSVCLISGGTNQSGKLVGVILSPKVLNPGAR